MKIFFVSTFGVKCGIATYTSSLAQELIKQGHSVEILSENPDVLPNNLDLDFEGLNIPSYNCWRRNEGYTKISGFVKENDIVHIQHQFGLFPDISSMDSLYKNLKLKKTKVITTMHDVISFCQQYENYFKIINNFSDIIIVHNEVCKRLLIDSWKFNPEKIKLIYHGTKNINVPSKKEALKSLVYPENSKIILSWGFLWESKGIDSLVEIFNEILKKYPEAILVHAGGLHPLFKSNEYLASIFKMAFKLGIKPTNFKITGFVKEKDIPTYFGASDVIILNYVRGSASASGAGHRALASQRPIVKTDDICLEEIPGLVVPKLDKKSLLNKILNVLEDSNLVEETVKKQNKVALETSWENIAKQHVKEAYLN